MLESKQPILRLKHTDEDFWLAFAVCTLMASGLILFAVDSVAFLVGASAEWSSYPVWIIALLFALWSRSILDNRRLVRENSRLEDRLARLESASKSPPYESNQH
ncbi:MAG: hypothetical protein WD069_08655 [Planctomycetales bacterium]